MVTYHTTDEDNVHHSDRKMEVPTTDLLTWLFANEHLHDPGRLVGSRERQFDQGKKTDRSSQLYIDANNPSRSLTFAQTRTAVRAIINGLHAMGIKRGDCVAVHTYNVSS